MATYGNFPNAQVPFTGWSPTLALGPANAGNTAGAAQFNGYTQRDDRDIKGLRTAGGRGLRQLLRSLVGNSPGPTAQEFRYRIRQWPSTTAMAGSAVIETVAYINRATTANDDTQLTAFLDRATRPAAYPVDLSGNGGGGKLHYVGIG